MHASGLRFRLHQSDLPGTPDIVLSRPRVAVFVDGCFWHACPAHGVRPRTNADWWATKLDGNVARDRRNDRALQDAGWLVVHVWEHEDPDVAAANLHRIWSERGQVPAAVPPAP